MPSTYVLVCSAHTSSLTTVCRTTSRTQMSTTVTNVTIVGGHGQVAIRLAALLAASTAKTYAVTPVIRNPAHAASLIDLPTVLPNSITPVVLSLEDDPVSEFTAAFIASKADVIVFSAGANAEGERTKKVDYEGAVKIYDAIEGVAKAGGKAPRLILVSALDVRNPDVIPGHYVRRLLLRIVADLTHFCTLYRPRTISRLRRTFAA